MAAFVSDSFQSPELRVVTGTSDDAGVGVDRRAGDYTLSATVLVHGESYDTPLTSARSDSADGRGQRNRRNDVSRRLCRSDVRP